jgi:hypothetical protein
MMVTHVLNFVNIFLCLQANFVEAHSLEERNKNRNYRQLMLSRRARAPVSVFSLIIAGQLAKDGGECPRNNAIGASNEMSSHLRMKILPMGMDTCGYRTRMGRVWAHF